MEPVSPTINSTSNGALGARFKAGLQSALSVLVTKAPSLSPQHASSNGDMENGSNSCDYTSQNGHMEDDSKVNGANGDHDVLTDAPDTDVLLGESDHGETEADTHELDDDLLDDDPGSENRIDDEPICKKARLTPDVDLISKHVEENGKVNQKEDAEEQTVSKETPKTTSIIENAINQLNHVTQTEDCQLDNSSSSQKAENKETPAAVSHPVVSDSTDTASENPSSPEVDGEGKEGDNTVEEKAVSQLVMKSSESEETSEEISQIDNKIDKSDLEPEATSEKLKDHTTQDMPSKDDDAEINQDDDAKIDSHNSNKQENDSSLPPSDITADDKPWGEADVDIKIVNKPDSPVKSVDNETIGNVEGNSEPLGNSEVSKSDISQSVVENSEKNVINRISPNIESSPERNRSADEGDLVSPPPMQTSMEKPNLLSESLSSEAGDPEQMEVDIPSADEKLVDSKNTTSEPREKSSVGADVEAVQSAVEDLVGKAVACVDEYQTTSVHTGRASPHVSPSHSEDEEAEEIVLSQGSAGETSDDDSRDTATMAKRPKMSPDPGRLNKLISHLSTTLDEEASAASAHQQDGEVMEEDHNHVLLKKNGLASFYDTIIKKDVVSECFHEELSCRHKELQNKNSISTKKINKILQEVKAVREKLKQMNVRPAQRSVSTQIFTEKLQVTPEQLSATGNKILKSTVKSQKALVEQQKVAAEQQAAEAKAKALAVAKAKEAERLRAVELQKRSAPPAQQTSAQPQNRIAQMLAQPLPNSSTKPQPVSKPSTSSSGTGSEVIDLTAEEEQEKNPGPPPRTTVPSSPNTSATVNGTIPKAIHPAPLPPCPLTGKPGHHIKPPCPNLDLSAKQDGIVLQWNMILTKAHAKIATYQIFGYKQRAGALLGNEWKKVGDLKALPLPMACTLTQFQTGHTYHFAVRAVDELGRTGPFGAPKSTRLK